jgi:tRNA 2-thiouridine synthesizing protein A
LIADGDAVVVDAEGLRCPLPVTRLAAAVAEIEVGRSLLLLSTDPASRVDVPVWCRLHRHRLVAVEQHEDGWRFHVVRIH